MSPKAARATVAALTSVILLLATGWYFDHTQRDTATTGFHERNVVGSWKHPFRGSGYWENLNLNANGTFRRKVWYREGRVECAGTFEVVDSHTLWFEFSDYFICGDRQELTETQLFLSNALVTYGFDAEGNLLLVNLNASYRSGPPDEVDECYIPSRNYERGAFRPVEETTATTE